MLILATITGARLATSLQRLVPRQGRRESGASLVEYALLVALIAVVCVAAVTFFGGETSETFSRVGDSVQST